LSTDGTQDTQVDPLNAESCHQSERTDVDSARMGVVLLLHARLSEKEI